MNEIETTLTRMFDRQRIVFWYDAKRELRAECDALALPGVEKNVLSNNQFGVKYRILREAPEQKFLLYHEGPPPEDLDNWLLDVELASGSFRADQTALWAHELGLGPEFAGVIGLHAEFFQAVRRREALKAALLPDDTPRQVQLKMLAVCTNAEPRGDDIVENLLAELAVEKDDRIKLVQRCALDGFLWDVLARAYGYTSTAPGVRDFTIALFKSCYAMSIGEPSALNTEALVFLKRWKDSVRHQAAFEALSQECANILNIEQDLQGRNYRKLAGLDAFELVDRKILSDLVQDVANKTLPAPACVELIRQRRQSHWYANFEHDYEAIQAAALFLQALAKIDLTVGSLSDGIERYSRSWYQLDQLYRQFISHARRSGQTTLLSPLLNQVENLYTNNYLLPLNDRWQSAVDGCVRWDAPPVLRQDEFFEKRVRPFLRKGNKVCVVISDALRYEIGEELLRSIRQEDRYEATLEPALTVLPSYTQLGMAALLPHETLALTDDGTGLVNGNSSQGTENRRKILDQALPGRATAIRADDLLALSKEDSRALIRDHEVVYVYHNRIDATGDKRETEERVFEAVDETLDELVRILKKLANANASNMLVTADHGFIYQQRELAESDFASQEPSGTQIVLRNRRFVLGHGLVQTASFKRFTAADVGLDGTMEMLIPKSINRLRVKGSGSRYVHGGAALQEVVIPILQINKKRQSDVTRVGVDIIRGATSIITSGQLAVTFYQTEPVTEKVQPRALRAGIYTQAGELISDQHELTFDIASDSARDRERRVQFVLTQKANAANGQEVILRLEEKVPDTTHYREVRTARYTLRRSFTSDFDF